MVKYEEADLFRDTELQTELRDRTDSEIVTLPQLFIDGQHIGVRMLFNNEIIIILIQDSILLSL